MAVANTFIFGGVSTTTYGVIVEGSGDYSGAKRAVEMISIPGRDGAFALDKGYYENEPVEYDVLIQGATQTTFEAAVSSFKNAILSKTGYQRLTDTYHPNEYRMAVYAGGFDEEPKFHGKGASFKVKFDCKPQRFLTSGETASTVANNGTMTNPTLFDAKPLLEVEGYGTIGFNGYEIEIASVDIGDITLANSGSGSNITLSNTSNLNSGDEITVRACVLEATYGYSGVTFKRAGVESISGADKGNASATASAGGYKVTVRAELNSSLKLAYGTSKTTTMSVGWYARHEGGNTLTATTTLTLAYNGSSTITLSSTYSSSTSATQQAKAFNHGNVTAYSTKPYNFGSIFVDCDLGEFYRLENGVPISMNHVGDLGSDLPKLAPGSNTFTKDNTITQLKVKPRWWKV